MDAWNFNLPTLTSVRFASVASFLNRETSEKFCKKGTVYQTFLIRITSTIKLKENLSSEGGGGGEKNVTRIGNNPLHFKIIKPNFYNINFIFIYI